MFKPLSLLKKVMMDETHLSVFHSVLNRAHGKRSRNSLFRGSVHFQLVYFIFSNKRLYDIHVTWFYWFLHREGDRQRTALKEMTIHVFTTAGQIQKRN